MDNQDHYIHIRSSTSRIQVGHYVIFHVKTNFPFKHFDWIIMSKDIVLHSGREYGDDVHSEIKTFSLVTSPEMAPGFHVLVYAKAGFRYVLAFYHKYFTLKGKH